MLEARHDDDDALCSWMVSHIVVGHVFDEFATAK